MPMYNVLDKDGSLCGIVEADSAEAAVTRVLEMQKKHGLPETATQAEEKQARPTREAN